jgi:hypothetical protein
VSLHLVLFIPLHEEPLSRRWLAANYGVATAVAVLAICPWLVPGHTFEQSLTRFVIRNVYSWSCSRSCCASWRFARRGSAARRVGEARTVDVVLIGCGAVGAVGWVLFALFGDFLQPMPLWMRAYDTVVALLLAAPSRWRLRRGRPRLLFVGVMAAATMALYFGMQAAGASLTDQRLRPVVDLAAIVALLVVLVPGSAWVRDRIDRLVFRRSRHRREELRTFLQTLTPDLGAIECSRRALAELARVLHLRAGDSHARRRLVRRPRRLRPRRRRGHLAARGGRRPAPRDGPRRLCDARVPTRAPGGAPRDRRGGDRPRAEPAPAPGPPLHDDGLFAAAFSDEDVATVESFAAQLALLLDGAELLARAAPSSAPSRTARSWPPSVRSRPASRTSIRTR